MRRAGDVTSALHNMQCGDIVGLSLIHISMAYSREVEDALTEIIERFEGSLEYSLKDLKREEEGAIDQVPEHLQRFYAIKLLENDEKIRESLKNPPDVSDIIARIEKHFDDDTESVITNERYTLSLIHICATTLARVVLPKPGGPENRM